LTFGFVLPKRARVPRPAISSPDSLVSALPTVAHLQFNTEQNQYIAIDYNGKILHFSVEIMNSKFTL